MKETIHKPVLLEEVLSFLSLKSGYCCIDCTLGGAGYSLAISQKIGPEGKLLAIDLDLEAISRAQEIIKEKKIKNIILESGNFKDIEILAKKQFKENKQVDAIVADLGLSMDQLKDQFRTFSFNSQAKLNFSYSQQENFGKSLGIINNASVRELTEILRSYGEERFAGPIAKKIVFIRAKRKIKTGAELKEVIEQAVPRKYWPKGISVATKSFQALRIVVNNEFQSLEEFLPKAVKILKPGGRLVIVSFHSLEDRIVKRYFKKVASDCICPKESPICNCNYQPIIKIINKKPITASEKELQFNPSSRSAKLRVVEKI
ncbi:MAG: 16S rRNA (cytosine(1402)-N(4))-methyltransferase RsmH [Candidatus Pacebacteria bacterium]|nr:16S rRNA (cytosine(1402)-N(4))-methyltransferase RsmH [Candidatus Paceibacterota bacterium]